MDKSRPRAMDITAPRRNGSSRRGWSLSRRQFILMIIAAVIIVAAVAGAYWYRHRNDQAVLHDRYQVVYLLTGQVYFGKLQNTSGAYLTLKNVFTLENKTSADTSADTSNTSNILQVSRQVYGPDDSMAIRADQVQFWQNLRADSKVAQAIASTDK